jgi:hypothetical protein
MTEWVGIIALLLVIIAIIAIAILYLIYFAERDGLLKTGINWSSLTVSNDDDSIAPNGGEVYYVDGGNVNKGAGDITVKKPTDSRYVNKQFYIVNTSTSSNLSVKVDNGLSIFPDGSQTINAEKSALFFWKTEDTLTRFIDL